MIAFKRFGQGDDALGFVAVQADGFDQFFKLSSIGVGESSDGLVSTKKRGSGQVDPFISRLGREYRRDGELYWRLEIKRACGVGIGALEEAGNGGGG